MIEPVSAGSAAAGRIAGPLVLKKVREWLKGDEFDRLLEEVADRLGPTGPLALAPLRSDEKVVALIAAFLDDPGAWNASELVKTIEPHVGALTDEGSPRETAEVIARLIYENAARAIKDDREALLHELRSPRNAGPPSVVVLSFDWVPRDAQARVQELARTNPAEAHHLEQELADESRRSRILDGLIRRPKAWVAEGSAPLWVALGDLATAYGLLEAAEQAFVAAAESPGSDRVRMLIRAAQVAYAREDDRRGDDFLNEARQLDPDHPSVAIVEAVRLSDPAAQLVRLEGINALDDLQAVGIETTRAQAHLALGNLAEAKAACARAAARGRPTSHLAELTSAVVYVENANRSHDEPIDFVALAEAARSYLELREEALALGRVNEAGRLGARASEIYSMVGDYRRAGLLVDELTIAVEASPGSSNDATRRHLASAAIEARVPERVGPLLASVALNDVDRLMLIQSRALVERDPAGAVADLEGLLDSSDDVVRWQAARLLLVGAVSDGFDWYDRAEEIVREADEALADVIRASYLHHRGERDEAERLLHARIDDSRALESLIQFAVDREEWETALQLHEQLTVKGNTPERKYARARLLEKSGDIEGALAHLSRVMSDATAPVDVRARSYARSAELFYQRGNFVSFLQTAQQWQQLDPSDAQPAWLVVLGFARLGRWEEALDALDRREDGAESVPLEPLDEEDAELAASVIFHALPRSEAIVRIAEISDRFDRSIERLEGLIIVAGNPGDELPPTVQERVRRSMQEFERRFPDSQAMRTVEAPADIEGLTGFVREQVAEESSEAEETFRAVHRGEAPLTLLAALLRKHVPELWAVGGFLPIGYGDPTLSAQELADAHATILRPAVWDASALYVAGGLDEEVVNAVVSALPGSVLPQAILDDVIAWGDGPIANPDGEQMFLGWDAASQSPRVTIVPADETARQRASARGVHELAQRLIPVPNGDAAKPGRFDELLEVGKQGDVPPSFMSWPATFAVAAGLGRAIFSDDRYIRLQARRSDLPAFGTVALLRALAERGMLDGAVVERSVRRLRASGAVGLIPSDADLIAEISAADWDITELVARALLDPTGWTEIPTGLRRVISVLRAVFRSAPERFLTWVDRALEAARISRPDVESARLTGGLLALSWISDDPAFARAMTAAVQEMRHGRGYVDDPVPFAAQLLVNIFAHAPEPGRELVTRTVFRATPYREHPELLTVVGLAGAPQRT
jgi:tetratricopeptide (TPR) repeat protein